MKTTTQSVNYRVNEIFTSIEGEGKRTGLPCTFVRLFGCNLRCDWGGGCKCDSPYSWDPKLEDTECHKMLTADIVTDVLSRFPRAVTLTGGEPLLQNVAPLLKEFSAHGIETNIETNGSIPLISLAPYKAFYTMDWKCPGSKMNSKMLINNLHELREQDVLKFVVGSTQDLEELRSIYQLGVCKAKFYVSPVWGKITLARIVDYVQTNKLKNVYVQCQLHKAIYPPDMRGV